MSRYKNDINHGSRIVLTTLEQLRAGLPADTRHLKMSCGLTEFPREIFNLADTLESLDLSGNALSSLPDDLPRLRKLRIIFCSNNRFAELPEVLGRCPQLSMMGFKANQIVKVMGAALPVMLRWLILTDNQVQVLPPEIGNCAQLQKLMLAGNRLQALPAELAACARLELLRLAANQLDGLPAWLTSMPRLSWLAYAGNPLSEALETDALIHTPINPVDWHDLALGRVLGEGASGVIYRAKYLHSDNTSLPVAVKLFKGAVTSDGLPRCEMAACINAGEHRNLIPVLGKVQAHPQGADALVLTLIDPEFRNLAGPPSLDSCTRDIYAEDVRFTLSSALSMAYGIASAACHLHEKGIMHGDLYAHNILHCGEGRALLGDFGAASFYSAQWPHAQALQRLEVRAYGCLLEELLDRCDFVDPSLIELNNRCLSENVDDRPLFSEIVSALSTLMET
jgi:hypothetical protein